MPQDRSIRNIEIRHRNHAAPPPVPPPPEPRRRPRGRGRLWLVALVVIVIAAVGGLLLSTIFAGATVTVMPRTADVTLPPSITAALNAPAGTLSYQTFTVTQSATTTVPANGTEQVQTPASGVITISNAYSTAAQKLIANTRFAAPDGKIYRIHQAVTVPGMSGSTPGTVTITAYADEPGPDYNRSGTTNYTIPGFSGDPRFSKITASSGPMTGGFVGTQPSVSDADLTAARGTLESQLATAVQGVIANQVPDGYAVIRGLTTISYSGITQAPGSGNTAQLSETATGSGAVVRIADIASAVAKATVSNYAGEAITFEQPGSVTVSGTSTSPTAGDISVLLSGSSPLVWVFDPNALKAALVGQPKSKLQDIVSSFQPAVLKLDASIRPFWTSTFPSDPNKITIKTQTSQ